MSNPGPDGRHAVLADATTLVCTDRNAEYGEPEDSFNLIANLWSSYLHTKVLPQDVAALMILMKVARLQVNPTHRDSWVDVAGYAACGGNIPSGHTGSGSAR